MVSAGGRIWIGTHPVKRHTGGTLRLLRSEPLSIDPAVNVELGPLQAAGLTADGLVNNNLASGPQGLQIVPDLALAIPLPADHGLTYTFHLRPGIRYSNGERLRAGISVGGSSASSGCARALASTSGDPRRERLYGASCDLSRGVVTDDAARTVMFHLTAPDPGFVSSLGTFASPVPAGTPWHAVRTTPIPGTGPYRIEHASRSEIRYVRNPYFREWSHAAQPDGNPDVIVMRFGLSPAEEVRAVERGAADWTADGIPPELLSEVTTRYAGRVHTYATSGTEFLQLNTTLAPFDDVRVRRALNDALDRRVVVRLFGGSAAAAPACQILPPGLLGYEPYCPYTRNPGRRAWTAPDLAAAQRLVSASHTRGTSITVWGAPQDLIVQYKVIPYVLSVLRQLGYRPGRTSCRARTCRQRPSPSSTGSR